MRRSVITPRLTNASTTNVIYNLSDNSYLHFFRKLGSTLQAAEQQGTTLADALRPSRQPPGPRFAGRRAGSKPLC